MSGVVHFIRSMYEMEFLTTFGWINGVVIILIFSLAALKTRKLKEQFKHYGKPGVVTEKTVFICFIMFMIVCAALLAVIQLCTEIVKLQ